MQVFMNGTGNTLKSPHPPQWVVLGVDGEQKDFNPKNRQFQPFLIIFTTIFKEKLIFKQC